MQSHAASFAAPLSRPALTPRQVRRLVDLVIWLLLTFYLVVDSITGFLLHNGLPGTVLSQIYKAHLLALLLLALALHSPRMFTLALAAITCNFLGPVLRLVLTGDTYLFWEDFVDGTKVVTPLVVIMYTFYAQQYDPIFFARWARRCLWTSVAIMGVNLCAGLAGYGFATYGVGDETRVGTTGFFFAGNEVSAVYILLVGFFLMEVWIYRRWLYIFVVPILIALSFAIATKTAILATLILASGMPLIYERGRHWRLTRLKLALFTLTIVLIYAAIMQFWALLELAGLADRFRFVLARWGVVGLLLSGRDQYIAQGLSSFMERAGVLELFTGIGQGQMDRWTGKASVEIDLIDVFLWLGLPGLLVQLAVCVIVGIYAFHGYRDRTNPYGPGVMLTSWVLMGAACISGHILLSGMLGLVWGVFLSFSANKYFCRPNHG